MLLKHSQSEKRTKISGNLKQQRGTGNMKLIVGSYVPNSRLPRKAIKGFSSKRSSSHLRVLPGQSGDKHRTPIDASDNSNDSGLGFDQHLDASSLEHTSNRSEHEAGANGQPESKRKKVEFKTESDDANDNFTFSQAMSKSRKTTLQTGGSSLVCLMPSRGSAGALGLQRPLSGTAGCSGNGSANGVMIRCSPGRNLQRPTGILARRTPGPISLSSNLMSYSHGGRIQLHIASQPEQQHRARYQTEGSRGAVKDRSGNGFPVVKLIGYNKPATMQVFIGTDMGRVAPHMFYQACKVSGKNSTPCVEKKIDGTIVIEVDFDPAKDMTITCDCVGILKERNVDVEHRFPDQSGARNKKKSTRCRMVFRATITHPDGSSDILQTSSHPIVCTQPPGVPEICKKSLSLCACTGGLELFILGKNFLKDTRVVFQQNDSEPVWEETVQPDKEYLQQTHLVCIVPAYQRCDILEPITVRLLVTSSGKTSEPHSFTYMPATNPVLQHAVGTSDTSQSFLVPSGTSPGRVDLNRVFNKPSLGSPTGLILAGSAKKSPTTLLSVSAVPNHYLPVDSSHTCLKKEIHPVPLWAPMALTGDTTKPESIKGSHDEHNKVLGLKMMPPPPLLPISSHRTSSNILVIPDVEPVISATELKTEVIDESSQVSNQLSPEELKGIDLRMKPVATVVPMATVSDLLSTRSPSLATFRQFVSNPSDAPLPTQSGLSVEKYLSHIENSTATKVAGEAVVATIPSDIVLRELNLNKLCNSEKAMNSRFMFDQASNSSLITPGLSSGLETAQKVAFVNATALPNIYSSRIITENKQQKPRLVEQTTIQDNMAHELLAVGHNSGNQAKSKYQESSLSDLCCSQTLPSTLLTCVPDTILPEFPPPVSSSNESSLNVPTIAETSRMMENSSSLIFSSSQQTSKSMHSADMSQKTDEQLIDNTSNCNNSSSGGGILGTQHTISLLSPSTISGSANLDISSPTSLTAVTNPQSTLMTGASDTRLSALVSSAIESRIIESNQQTQTSEKLGYISTSERLINTVSSKNSTSGSQTPVVMTNNLVANQSSTSPIQVQDITINSTLAVPPVSSFPLNTLSAAQSSAQITQENLILSNTVAATFNENILTSGSSVKTPETLVLNPVNEQSLTLETHVSSIDGSHRILNNSSGTSPIAINNTMLNFANAVDADLSTNHSQTSESRKNAISSPTVGENDGCLSSANHTSPAAMKTMILGAPSEGNKPRVTSTAVEDMCTHTPLSTSPIVMKKIVFESASMVRNVLSDPAQQIIAVKNVLTTQPSNNSLLSSVPSMPLATEKLDVLVESTANKHIQPSATTNMSVETTSCSSTNSLPLTTQSLASILASSISPNLSNSTSLDDQNTVFVPKTSRRCIHSSVVVNSIDTRNISLTSSLNLQNAPSDIITSQTQSVSESSLMTMFSRECEPVAKTQSLESVPAITSLPLVDNRMFDEQPDPHVHSLSSKQDNAVTLSHLLPFPSSNSNNSELLIHTPCNSLSPKIGDINSCPVQGKEHVSMINEVLMELGSGENEKKQVVDIAEPNCSASKDVENSKYPLNSIGTKNIGSDNFKSRCTTIRKLDVVQAVNLQQQVQQQEKPREQTEQLTSSTSLPLPVAETSSDQATKSVVPVVTGPMQKKLDDHLVPQELTQMSESDLLSYINPSCFDQV